MYSVSARREDLYESFMPDHYLPICQDRDPIRCSQLSGTDPHAVGFRLISASGRGCNPGVAAHERGYIVRVVPSDKWSEEEDASTFEVDFAAHTVPIGPHLHGYRRCRTR